MSSFKRFVDMAKSEVGALRERVAGRKLDEYTDDELVAEIERRRLEKLAHDEDEARKAAEAARKARAAPVDSDNAASAEKAQGPRQRRPDASSPVTKTLAQYYANLEVPIGSDLETVKRAYRKLMRKYHPDRHADDPVKYKSATELAQSLTRAYMEVKKHIESQGR